jgi:hypothetical protein
MSLREDMTNKFTVLSDKHTTDMKNVTDITNKMAEKHSTDLMNV